MAVERLALRSVAVQFCSRGGSSAGTREYVAEQLVPLAREHPHIEFHVSSRPNRPPVVTGTYANTFRRVLELSNQTPREIHERIMYLRDTLGRTQRKPSQLSFGVVSRRPSVQGMTRSPKDAEQTAGRVSPTLLRPLPEAVPSFGELVRELGARDALQVYEKVVDAAKRGDAVGAGV